MKIKMFKLFELKKNLSRIFLAFFFIYSKAVVRKKLGYHSIFNFLDFFILNLNFSGQSFVSRYLARSAFCHRPSRSVTRRASEKSNYKTAAYHNSVHTHSKPYSNLPSSAPPAQYSAHFYFHFSIDFASKHPR